MSGRLSVEHRHCAVCGDERLFERPPCADGCDDCPDWACVDCGVGILIGWSEAAVVSSVAPGGTGGTAAAVGPPASNAA